MRCGAVCSVQCASRWQCLWVPRCCLHLPLSLAVTRANCGPDTQAGLGVGVQGVKGCTFFKSAIKAKSTQSIKFQAVKYFIHL